MPYHLTLSPVQLDAFCRRWKIARLDLFGSALRNDFRPDSDVDILVSFSTGARWGLLSFVRMKEELSALVGRRVDLVSRRAVEGSENPLRRASILDSARPLHVSG